MKVNFLFWGCLLAATAVALGAFGAHGFKNILTTTGKAEVFETATRYHFYHSLGLVGIGLWQKSNASREVANRNLVYAGWLFLVGILFFSGALYVLALTGFTKLGMVAPLGGLAFIVGWLLCAKTAINS